MPSRREFLIQAGATAVGFGAIRLLSGCETIDVQPKVQGGAFDFITKDDDWYYKSGHGTSPEKAESIGVSRNDWKLTLAGPNGKIATLDFNKLKSMEKAGRSTTYIKTMRCVVGAQVGAIATTFVSTGVFTGIPLPELFKDYDVPLDSTAKMRTFGADGFASNLTVDRAANNHKNEGDPLPAMLAYRMNGEPLASKRGGPVRLVIPEMWGFKNMKWVERLKFTKNNAPFGGYEGNRPNALFEGDPAQDIIDKPAKIALTDFLTRPGNREGIELEGPDITIQGASVAGDARIEEVGVKLDGGSFKPADELSKDAVLGDSSIEPSTRKALERAENFGKTWPPKGVWMIWSKTFEGLEKGSHTITVQSTDSNGRKPSKSLDQVGDRERYKVAPQLQKISFKVV